MLRTSNELLTSNKNSGLLPAIMSALNSKNMPSGISDLRVISLYIVSPIENKSTYIQYTSKHFLDYHQKGQGKISKVTFEYGLKSYETRRSFTPAALLQWALISYFSPSIHNRD